MSATEEKQISRVGQGAVELTVEVEEDFDLASLLGVDPDDLLIRFKNSLDKMGAGKMQITARLPDGTPILSVMAFCEPALIVAIETVIEEFDAN